MRLEDLFPPLPDGTRAILPHQRALIAADEKYVCLKGGYGGGKTLPACVKCYLLLAEIPGNRGIMLRRSYPKLNDPVIRTFLEVLERAGASYERREMRDGWPHRLLFPNDSEIVFRETKDLGRLLGPEYGFWYVDEAAEEPEKTFLDLMGRLRLPHAAGRLHGLLTTNPPHHTHWIPARFGLRDGIQMVGGSAFRLLSCASTDNPALPDDYVQDLIANNTPSEVRRIIGGEYGFSPDGKPVLAPPFMHERHVGLPILRPAPIIRAWDFGYRHPAVTWHQAWRCGHGTVHWSILEEVDNSRWLNGKLLMHGLEAEALADRVLEISRKRFPGCTNWFDVGDAAGAQHNDRGPGPIVRLAKSHGLHFRTKAIKDINPGLDFLRQRLRLSCPCRVPGILIHRECRHLIDGCAGGYHYPNLKSGSLTMDRPVKDGFYDDFLDSVRYAGDIGVRRELADPGMIDALIGSALQVAPEDVLPHWAWLER